MSFDLFGVDPERQARNASMNGLIKRSSQKGVSYGSLGATGRPTSQVPDATERNARAVSDLEAAERSKDPDAIAFAEHVLDKRIDEARASRGEAPRDEDRPRDSFGRFTDTFDGGVRGRGVAGGTNAGNRLQESAHTMFKQAIQRSREESAETTEGTILANS